MSEADLLEHLRAGDEAAFEQLFRSLHASLCEVVDSYVRSQDTAEEIVQDLFFVFWMKRASIEIMGSVRGYLFAAARNRALHHLRHRHVQQRVLSDAAEDARTAAHGQGATTPDRAVEREEAARALREAVDNLPVRSRLAFVLVSERGFTQPEVAEAMGITVKGVEKLLSIARRHLRETLRRLNSDSEPLR